MSRWNIALALLTSSSAIHRHHAFIPTAVGGTRQSRRSLPALGVKNYMDSLSQPQQPPSDDSFDSNANSSNVSGEIKNKTDGDAQVRSKSDVPVAQDYPLSFPDSPAEAGLHDFAQETVSKYFVEPDTPGSDSDNSSTPVTGVDLSVEDTVESIELGASEETKTPEPAMDEINGSEVELEITSKAAENEPFEVIELEVKVEPEPGIEAIDTEGKMKDIEFEEEPEEVIESVELVNDQGEEETMEIPETEETFSLDTSASTVDDDADAKLETVNPVMEIDISKLDNSDENVSLAIESVSVATLGDQTSWTYMTQRKSLSDSTARNIKRVSRSEFERKKAAEKIFAIKARMEAQIKEVGNELDDKLNDMQEKLTAETAQIERLLQSQVSYEASRKENISTLVTTVRSAIESKQDDIAAEDKITAEMIDVRSKLKEGNISSQLDDLIEQKRQVAELEKEQVKDLGEILVLVEDILDRTVRRETQIQKVLDNIELLDITSPSGVDYDFNDLAALEGMWKNAATELGSDGEKLAELKLKFDGVILSKIQITGGEIPESLKAATRKLNTKMAAEQRSKEEREMSAIIKAQVRAKQAVANTSKSAISESVQKQNDQREDYELIGLVAKSLSSAAVDSAKAGIFGIRAIMDAVKEEDIANKLKKQDADSVQAIGEIAKKMSKTKSAEKASTALKETSNDLSDALKAIASLTKKNLGKIANE